MKVVDELCRRRSHSENPNRWRRLACEGDPTWIDLSVCESVLEESFAYQVAKTKDGLYGVFAQVPIAGYRVDFLAMDGERKIVVELDGKAFHNKKRDYYRDKEIIKHVDTIIRIPFSSMTYCENATMVAISLWEPRLAVASELSTIAFQDAVQSIGGIKNTYTADTRWMQVYLSSNRHALVGSFQQIACSQNIVPITI